MPDSQHPLVSPLDEALTESQRREREERDAYLEKQRRSDERVVDALSPPAKGS